MKETYLATVLATLVAKDITIKLYSMNSKVMKILSIFKIRKNNNTFFSFKIMTDKGSHLDIRLPSITPALASKDYKAPIVKTLKKQAVITSHCPSKSPVPAGKFIS